MFTIIVIVLRVPRAVTDTLDEFRAAFCTLQ